MKKLRLNKDIVAKLAVDAQRRIVGGGTTNSVAIQTDAYETFVRGEKVDTFSQTSREGPSRGWKTPLSVLSPKPHIFGGFFRVQTQRRVWWAGLWVIL